MDRWLAVDPQCSAGEDSDSLRSTGSSSPSSGSFSPPESRSSQTSLGLDLPEKPPMQRRRPTPKLSLQVPSSRSPAMLNLGPVYSSPLSYVDERSPNPISPLPDGLFSYNMSNTPRLSEEDSRSRISVGSPYYNSRPPTASASTSPNDDGEQTPHVTNVDIRGSPSHSIRSYSAESSASTFTETPVADRTHTIRHRVSHGDGSGKSPSSPCFAFEAPAVQSPHDSTKPLPSLSPLGAALNVGPERGVSSGFTSAPGTRRKKMPAPLDLRSASVFAPTEISRSSNTLHVRDLMGVEGSQQQDRVIGKLMMKQQCETKNIEMRSKRPSLGVVTSGRSLGSPGFQAAASRPSSSSRPTLNRAATTFDYSESVSKSLVSTLRVSEDENGNEDDEKYPYEHGPREIVPGIWLGSEQNASDPELLHSVNISSILNVAKEVACPYDNGLGVDALLAQDSAQSQQSQGLNPTVCVTSDGSSYASNDTSCSDVTDPNGRFGWMQQICSPTNTEPLFFTQKGPLQELDYCWIKWSHNESELVESGEFDRAFAFLDAMRAQKRNILIHCQCGVSRSATVTIAYLMRETARKTFAYHSQIHSMHDAYSFVKQKSSWIGPNLGLIFQLVAYERKLKDQGSLVSNIANPLSGAPSPPAKDISDRKWPVNGSDKPFLTPQTAEPPSHSSTPQSSWGTNSSPGATSSVGSSPCTSATSWSSRKCI